MRPTKGTAWYYQQSEEERRAGWNEILRGYIWDRHKEKVLARNARHAAWRKNAEDAFMVVIAFAVFFGMIALAGIL